jgi:3',5'-cyclic AMP phosphodiesterase CpdA
MYRLLHLSDLHFGDKHHFAQDETPQGTASLAQAVHGILEDNDLKVDHIVFTGDFFSNEQSDDHFQAKTGIEEFKTLLGLRNENLSFIPGNHDLSWKDKFKQNPFRAYNELVAAFEHEDCNASNLPIVRRIDSGSSPRPIFLALLNSCTVEGKELAGIGNVGDKQLRKLRREIQKIKKDFDDYVLIAALHHHLLPIYPVIEIKDPFWPEAAPKGRSSHTLDAIDVLDELSKLNTALIIHGHQHRPAVISYKDRLKKSPELTIAAAGSCAVDGSARQFYVYEIDNYAINILSFSQDDSSSRFSKREDVELSIPLPHLSAISERFCREEAEIHYLPATVSESSGADVSDLHLLFLSVRDCHNARKVIREFVEKQPPENSCTLHGMYDLLGHWDLFVRLRFNIKLNFSDTEEQLYKELQKAHEMEEAGADFSDRRHINVNREAKSFKELLAKPMLPPPSLKRKVLGDTESYDLKRCQRGLLYIKLPEGTNRKNELIQQLSTVLDADYMFKNIVEGIYRGEFDLVIEFFMTCAQSQSVNQLNRIIEKKLTFYRIQKYTMFCYGYDEQEMLASLSATS